MTEAEWLAKADAAALLQHVRTTASNRKFQLYMCAGCTHIAHLFYDPASRGAVEVLERYADGQATEEEMGTAHWYAESPTFGYSFERDFGSKRPDPERQDEVARLVQMGALNSSALSGGEWVVNHSVQRRLLAAAELVYFSTYSTAPNIEAILSYIPYVDWPGRWLVDCVFGNPFRPVALDPAWLTSTVMQLAQGIYDERAFDRLPILADALQDAGCENPDVLDHCRGPGPHARGCWVVDLLLGKS